MTTANPQKRQFALFDKFNAEVRPSDLVRRDGRIPMTCSFEEIAESEEEDMQLSEQTSPEGRSPFAVAFESPFAEKRGTTSRNIVPHLYRGFSNPGVRCRQAPTMFGSLNTERHAGPDFLTLPPIPETAVS